MQGQGRVKRLVLKEEEKVGFASMDVSGAFQNVMLLAL